MANVPTLRKRLVPSVPFTISFEDSLGKFEKSFRLCFDFRALAAIEQILHVNLLANFASIFSVSATSVSVFFWAAILANHEEFADADGLDVVRSYFTVGDFEPAALAIQEAFKASLSAEQRAEIEAAIEAAKKKLEAERTGTAAPDPLAPAAPSNQ